MSFGRLGTLSLSKLGAPGGSKFDIYSIFGLDPGFVADFDGEAYRAAGSSTTFSGAITHAATSNATMTDSDGYIKWRPHNLLAYSEQFDNAYWTKTGGAITPDATTAPDGTSTADLFVENSGTSAHANEINGGITVTGHPYTISIYAKYSGRVFQIATNFSGTNLYANFDLQNGVLGTVSGGLTATITSVGDGWYLCSVVVTAASGSRNFYPCTVTTTTSGFIASYTGDGSSGVYLWGAHVYRSDLGGMVDVPTDARAFSGATTYVPTTTAAVYLPRRGHHIYDGVSAWVNEGVLHESEARTNLITYSAEFDNAAWIKTRSSISADAVAGPDGQTTADKLVEDSSPSNDHFIRFAVGDTAAPWTASFYVKAAERDRIITWVSNTGYLGFDLSTGAQEGAVGSNVTDYGIDDVGNGWYRIWFYSSTVSTGTNFNIGLYDSAYVSGFPTYSGDGSSGAYIWGAQVEAGATPSSYIPTSGATATRAAETLTIPSANLPWSGTAASLQMDGRVTYADTGSGTEMFWLQWGVGSDPTIRWYMATSGARTGEARFNSVDAVSTSVSSTSTHYSPGISVSYNIAGRHGSTFVNGALEGTALTEDATPVALPDLSATNLNLGNDYMGTIRTFRVWDVDLTDAGIEAAST